MIEAMITGIVGRTFLPTIINNYGHADLGDTQCLLYDVSLGLLISVGDYSGDGNAVKLIPAVNPANGPTFHSSVTGVDDLNNVVSMVMSPIYAFPDKWLFALSRAGTAIHNIAILDGNITVDKTTSVSSNSLPTQIVAIGVSVCFSETNNDRVELWKSTSASNLTYEDEASITNFTVRPGALKFTDDISDARLCVLNTDSSQEYSGTKLEVINGGQDFDTTFSIIPYKSQDDNIQNLVHHKVDMFTGFGYGVNNDGFLVTFDTGGDDLVHRVWQTVPAGTYYSVLSPEGTVLAIIDSDIGRVYIYKTPGDANSGPDLIDSVDVAGCARGAFQDEYILYVTSTAGITTIELG